MDTAQLSLASSLQALIKKQNSISNNLANLSSTAFKRRVGAFEPFAIQFDKARGETLPIPRFREYGDLSQGDIRFTNNPLHIAIQGEGFLRVRNPGNDTTNLFTRVGTLTVDPNGRLITQGGFEVLDSSLRPVTLPPGSTPRISSRGEITDESSGTQAGTIGLWRFEDKGKLFPLGAGLFLPTAASGTPEIDRFSLIQQRNLENSNVNSLQELVGMISVQRHFETVARALSMIEQVNDQLNQLARG